MSCCNILLIVMIAVVPSISEIKLVSVVFRHGDRTPDVVYPLLPYESDDYLPMGVGGLTNDGKKRAYQLGQILRKEYIKILGTTYFPGKIYARSTDYDRTKMTLQLVLAGLFPPNNLQRWNPVLNWQPIPTDYLPEPQDELFQRIYICDSHKQEQERVKAMPEIRAKLASFDTVMKRMSKKTGWNMTDIFDLYTLYCNFVCLNTMKWKVPIWASNAMPVLYDSTLTTLQIMNYNEKLRRLNGGALLRKISEEMISMTNGTSISNNRISLYSSHDINVYAVLSALNVLKPHLPEFTSAVIIELHYIKEAYYVKLQYYSGIPAQIKTLKIPDCYILCPLNMFLKLIRDVVPTNEELKCTKWQ